MLEKYFLERKKTWYVGVWNFFWILLWGYESFFITSMGFESSWSFQWFAFALYLSNFSIWMSREISPKWRWYSVHGVARACVERIDDMQLFLKSRTNFVKPVFASTDNIESFSQRTDDSDLRIYSTCFLTERNVLDSHELISDVAFSEYRNWWRNMILISLRGRRGNSRRCQGNSDKENLEYSEKVVIERRNSFRKNRGAYTNVRENIH